MAVLILVSSLLRKRLFQGITLALYGLAVFNLRFWGFGVPFLLAGAWYLVRAYRLQQALKRAEAAEVDRARPKGTPGPSGAAAPAEQALHAAHLRSRRLRLSAAGSAAAGRRGRSLGVASRRFRVAARTAAARRAAPGSTKQDRRHDEDAGRRVLGLDHGGGRHERRVTRHGDGGHGGPRPVEVVAGQPLAVACGRRAL